MAAAAGSDAWESGMPKSGSTPYSQGMRPRPWSRTLVSVTVLIGAAATGLASASPGFAVTEPTARPAVSADEAGASAVVNLGLTTTQAKGIQRMLKGTSGYAGTVDGYLGTLSWKALQKHMSPWYYDDLIDGIVGPKTIAGLQEILRDKGYYHGAIDGIAGSQTKAAFAEWADYCVRAW